MATGIPTVEEPTAASGGLSARTLGEVGEYADGVRMTVRSLDRDYRLPGRPGVPAIAVTVQVVNDAEETAGREMTADLHVRLTMSYGPDGRTADAVHNYRIGPRTLRPGQSVAGRFAFQVPTRTVQGLVFQGQPGDAYALIRWTA